MAAALFAGRPEFVREADGTWRLVPRDVAPNGHAAASGSGRVFAPYAPPSAVAERLVDDYRPVVSRGLALRKLSYTVIDVETTGTSAYRGDRVTDIAAVRVENGEVRDVFQTLVNPERSIPPYITRLTSITWDMVKDAPRFRDICDELLARMEGTVFVAHNVGFDWRFVSAEVERATGRTLEGRKLCTVRLARKVLPQLRRRSLDWVANHYGIEIEGRHRAGGDAVATAHCLVRMLGDAVDRGYDCWTDLETLLVTPQPRRRKSRRPSAMPQPVWRDTTA
jgi:DNA polymerase-3 subunit epsilon